MTTTKSRRIRVLAIGAAASCVLAGGATAALVPSVANAVVAKHGVVDTQNDDRLVVAKHGADDPAGHVRGGGADDPVGHARHGGDDPAGAGGGGGGGGPGGSPP